MKTQAVRLYGKKDLRLEEFELPPLGDNEILAQVVSDSVCMSTYKVACQGPDHKRVPADIAAHPIIIGHEFCGTILDVGRKWKGKFTTGSKFSIQPALNYQGSLDAPGYSYRYVGGDATYIVIPNEVMEQECLLPYHGDAFFYGSLSEPMSCIVGAFHAQFHTVSGSYEHRMDIAEGGCLAILAGLGPMGLGAIDYAIHRERKPRLVVVTSTDEGKIRWASGIFPPEEALKNGVTLVYVHAPRPEDIPESLLPKTGGSGFDDVFVFAPSRELVEAGDRLLARDGCLNFFAGPSDSAFMANVNLYNVHYGSTHFVGTSGGNTQDMLESLDMMSKGTVNPAVMITHVGGLDSVTETVLNLPSIPGGKKLIYTNARLPLTALSDFRAQADKSGKASKTDEMAFFAGLADRVEANNGIWSVQAETFLMENVGSLA